MSRRIISGLKLKPLSFTTTPEMIAKIAILASQSGMNTSQFIRGLIQSYFDRGMTWEEKAEKVWENING